jgi:hypothetical protein
VEWILFVVLQTGAAPMTPEHHLFQAVELGDRLMCEGLLDDMKNCMQSQYRIKLGFCAPKHSASLGPGARKRYEEKFPQYAPAKSSAD